MSNGHTKIVFRESRAGAALAIAALLPFDILAMALANAPNNTRHLAVIIFASAIIINISLVQLFYIAKMIFPSSLILTDDGADSAGLFKRFSLRWNDYNPATVQVKFSPKGGRSYYIKLSPKNGGNSIEIFRDGYTQSGDDVFRCVKEAQLGRLIDLGDETFPYGIVLGWIPFFVVAAALLAWKLIPTPSLILATVIGR